MSPGIPAMIKSNRTSSKDMVCCGLGSLTKGTFTVSNDIITHIARRAAVSQEGHTSISSIKDKLAPE